MRIVLKDILSTGLRDFSCLIRSFVGSTYQGSPEAGNSLSKCTGSQILLSAAHVQGSRVDLAKVTGQDRRSDARPIYSTSSGWRWRGRNDGLTPHAQSAHAHGCARSLASTVRAAAPHSAQGRGPRCRSRSHWSGSCTCRPTCASRQRQSARVRHPRGTCQTARRGMPTLLAARTHPLAGRAARTS